ncbi:unnamed protein product, partial [Lampetra planeri]
RLVVGNEHFGLLPGLTMYATIWLREHNRVCDILKAEHPTWDDEQLFQTARLIIIANRIALEFSYLYHWHPLMPDSFLIDGDEIPYSQFFFNTSLLMHYGVEKMVDAFSQQPAGQIGGGHNFHEAVLRVVEMVIRESRATRMQPFNEYRKRFNLKPYTSFHQFTDDEDMAKGLEEYYGDIDALEFYPGLILERTYPDGIFGESMIEIGAPFSLKGLFGNPICSPEYWKPSTFGGETGFRIVKTSTLKKLVCLNTKWCPYVSFQVPQTKAEPREDSTEL